MRSSMGGRRLAGLLEQSGWKNITVGVAHMGFAIDVIGERRYGPARWDVLVSSAGSNQ